MEDNSFFKYNFINLFIMFLTILSIISCLVVSFFLIGLAIMSFFNFFDCEKYFEKFISLGFSIFLIGLTFNFVHAFSRWINMLI